MRTALVPVESGYYIYAYLDPRKEGLYNYGDLSFKYEPFYIGKGSGDRELHHLHRAMGLISVKQDKNHFKLNKIKKIISEGKTPIIIRVFDNLNEEQSLAVEQALIRTRWLYW